MYDQYSVRVGLSGSKKQVHFDNLPLDNQARYLCHWASRQSSYVLGIFCISSGRDNELGYPTVTCQTRAILPLWYPFPYVIHRENSSDSLERTRRPPTQRIMVSM